MYTIAVCDGRYILYRSEKPLDEKIIKLDMRYIPLIRRKDDLSRLKYTCLFVKEAESC